MAAFAAPAIAATRSVFTVDLEPGKPIVHQQVVCFQGTTTLDTAPIPIGSLMQRVLAIYGLPDQTLAEGNDSTEADELCYSSRR